MRPFVDTNVLIYAATEYDPYKQQVAQRLLTEHTPAGLTISAQVLAETYNVLTRRMRWVPADALQTVRLLAGAMRTVSLATEQVLAALQMAAAHSLSTWDAMVVQAALDAGCDTLFSEDMQAGRRFGALQVVNPFATTAHEAPAEFAVAAVATAAPAPRAPRRPPARPAQPAPPPSSRRR